MPCEELAHAGPHQSAVLVDVQHPGGLRYRMPEVPEEIPSCIAHSYHQVRNPVPPPQKHAVRVESLSAFYSHQSDGTNSRQLHRFGANQKHRLAAATFGLTGLNTRSLAAP